MFAWGRGRRKQSQGNAVGTAASRNTTNKNEAESQKEATPPVHGPPFPAYLQLAPRPAAGSTDKGVHDSRRVVSCCGERRQWRRRRRRRWRRGDRGRAGGVCKRVGRRVGGCREQQEQQRQAQQRQRSSRRRRGAAATVGVAHGSLDCHHGKTVYRSAGERLLVTGPRRGSSDCRGPVCCVLCFVGRWLRLCVRAQQQQASKQQQQHHAQPRATRCRSAHAFVPSRERVADHVLGIARHNASNLLSPARRTRAIEKREKCALTKRLTKRSSHSSSLPRV